MERIDTIIARVSLWMARAGGVLLLLSAVIISIEIVARKVFLLPFSIGTELSTYALAIGGSWSFTYALLHRAHVRIDIFRKPLPPLARAVLDIVALISLAAVAVLLCRHAWTTFATSWSFGTRENTPLATPLAIPEGLWLLGLLWFALVCVQQVVVVLAALVRGDLQGVARIAAPAGEDAELKEALASVGARIEAPPPQALTEER
jgi:TRAP-type mannitol/chloroaromatic compound transport system permease small subunit